MHVDTAQKVHRIRRSEHLLALALPILMAAALSRWLVISSTAQAADGQTPAPLVSTADASIAPGDDFFAYANGSWLKAAAIPAGSQRWGARDELEELTRHRIAELLDAASGVQAGSAARKVANFRAAYLNEAAIETRGLASLKLLLERVDTVSDKAGLTRLLGHSMRADVDLNSVQVTLPPSDGEDAGKIQTIGARFAHGLITLQEGWACRTARTTSAPTPRRTRFASDIATTSGRCSRSPGSATQTNVRARCWRWKRRSGKHRVRARHRQPTTTPTTSGRAPTSPSGPPGWTGPPSSTRTAPPSPSSCRTSPR